MLNRPKSWFRAFFILNKSEQRGILILSLCIVVVLIINLLIPFFVDESKPDNSKFWTDIAAFQKNQKNISDSIQIEKLQNRGELNLAQAQQKLNPFPFDPNGLPEASWKKIGLTDKQIKSIKNYESKSGRFRKKEDVKKMYAISDIEYAILAPYIQIEPLAKIKPSNYNDAAKKRSQAKKRAQPKYRITEINSADTSALIEKLHLPGWLAERVLKYRNLLGGYYKKDQLLEVYGFKSVYFEKITDYVIVDQALIIKLNINTAAFKELVRHPYIPYELTKEIVNTRNEKGSFLNPKGLLNDELITDSLFMKLKPYLITDE